jgi:hypothetical protein
VRVRVRVRVLASVSERLQPAVYKRCLSRRLTSTAFCVHAFWCALLFSLLFRSGPHSRYPARGKARLLASPSPSGTRRVAGAMPLLLQYLCSISPVRTSPRNLLAALSVRHARAFCVQALGSIPGETRWRRLLSKPSWGCSGT